MDSNHVSMKLTQSEDAECQEVGRKTNRGYCEFQPKGSKSHIVDYHTVLKPLESNIIQSEINFVPKYPFDFFQFVLFFCEHDSIDLTYIS